MTNDPSNRATFSLGHADIETVQGSAPRSRQFGDVYFNAEDGLAESRHVFLGGCNIPQIWEKQTPFVVGELGFGTGLNFLATWHAWKSDPVGPAQIHFISVEGFPLTQDQMKGALSDWPELAPLAEQLQKAYPDPQPGFHRLTFEGGKVTLTLLLGPVLPSLESLDATVDAWFLDGFAPDRNPDMWHPHVFQEVARLSRTGTRLATFTVAGQVRRDLEATGFQLEKRSGWGKKREVLCGVFGEARPYSAQEPWYRPPTNPPKSPCDVVIIGSGLAGAATAHAFNMRGCKVSVIEVGTQIAAGASATPAAVLMPRLTADHSIDGQFYALAWRTCLALLDKIETDGFDLDRQKCGALRLAENEAEARRQKAVFDTDLLPDSLLSRLDATEASEVSGLPITFGGLFFRHGGTLSPTRLCEALLKDTHVLLNRSCAKLQRQNERWFVLDDADQDIIDADIVILANSFKASRFPQSDWLPTTVRLGQLSRAAETQLSVSLKCVIAGEGYITPSRAGEHMIGATFDHVPVDQINQDAPDPSEHSDARNIAASRRLVPDAFDGLTTRSDGSWTGLRCTTPDHLPLAGPLPDYAAYTADFAELRHGHRWSRYPEARYHPGLGVLTGLGAHGVIAAPLAAELLVSQILGEPCPLPRAIADGLHPGRFIVRDLKRRRA